MFIFAVSGYVIMLLHIFKPFLSQNYQWEKKKKETHIPALPVVMETMKALLG